MKIKVSRDGPYLVSGGIPLKKEKILFDSEGYPLNWDKNEKIPCQSDYCLCRCGKSMNKPFCDASHNDVSFDGTEKNQKSYAEQAEKISGPELELTDASNFCAGIGFCDRHKGTWELSRESGNRKYKKMAIQQACNCPSGRLVAIENGKEIDPTLEKEIGVIEGGPLWVKGKVPIESAKGKKYEARNRVTLCCCGKSMNKPFCDASHKL